ncbi:MAG: NADH-quinone oxidoreductase subunit NuoE [Nitrospiraceae bacterium]|nr:NADH-quinone oxidoreductase subunit NuoE [Nitrospiraceae bacterium]
MKGAAEFRKKGNGRAERPPGRQEKHSPGVDLSRINAALKGLDAGAPDAILPALRRTQEACGYIPKEAIFELAKRLKTTPAHLYGVATFYDQLSLVPQGRNVIRLCTNMACHVNGAESLLEFLRGKLKITSGNTTSDGRYTIIESECIGSCDRGPAMMVNDDYYYELTPRKIMRILARYK